MSRHRWTKLASHRYRCDHCGLDKHHEQAPVADTDLGLRRWVAVFLRDGVPVAQGRTPPCPGAVPVRLDWQERCGHVQRGSRGYQISAARVRDAWRFSAWCRDTSPATPPADATPPTAPDGPCRPRHLGVYPTAAAARAACQADAERRP